MKKVLLFLSFVFCSSITIQAQVMEDDFESNQYNWSELSSSRGKALIADGVLHLESKSKFVYSTCYAPFDVNKPFVLSVEALAKKLDGSKLFGILLDFEDERPISKNLFIIIAIIFRKWYFQEKGFFGLLLVNVGR